MCPEEPNFFFSTRGGTPLSSAGVSCVVLARSLGKGPAGIRPSLCIGPAGWSADTYEELPGIQSRAAQTGVIHPYAQLTVYVCIANQCILTANQS